ncbi:DASS family sodium-coupled anion symporter [Campylobacter fetus]|uniref:DASS family sodium-coupled anion symporter n=1 Tax=Campylobacter fetus TaxID=196 RepID=UPI0008188ACD|nr:DASS family sodium-coupled anion symporter [Campylobacter fetus]OCR93478.1 2-oxoglutarate translocator [Campylobacter fetus subsp. testudinum]
MKSKFIKGLVVIAIGVLVWFLPHPDAVSAQAWHLFAIVLATILGLIFQPLPIGAVAFFGVTVAILTNVMKPSEALSGYASTTIWLIVCAFMIARGFIKTGLGKRIAYKIISMLGDSTLKLGYSIVISDAVISPAMPSSGARAGGILFPIVKSLSSALGSEQGETRKKAGAFFMQTLWQGNAVTNGMFLTSMAGNPLIASLALTTFGVEISWGLWAMGAIVPALVSLAVIPYVLYKIYPPQIKDYPQGKEIARAELAKLGSLQKNEIVMISVFVGALILWATGSITGLDATTVGMIAVGVMLVFGVLEWNDFIGEKGAWDTLIWMGSLITLAGGLSKLGFVTWFASWMSGTMGGLSWTLVMGILVLVYVFTHYFFASLTAHITAMYATFGAVAIAAGADAVFVALVFAYASNLMMPVTHYGGAPAPIIFGAGYNTQNEWWRLGFIITLINLGIWIIIGGIWWKVLGLW